MVWIDAKPFDSGNLACVQVLFQALNQPIERGFGGVGNEAGDRVVKVVFHRFENPWHNGLAQSFALAVDVTVVASREVNALKAASLALSRRSNLFHMRLAVAFDDQG